LDAEYEADSDDDPEYDGRMLELPDTGPLTDTDAEDEPEYDGTRLELADADKLYESEWEREEFEPAPQE
jgi:hypothetical protein